MSKTMIFVLIGVVALVLLISFFVFIHISNKKKSKKLHENLKKIHNNQPNISEDKTMSIGQEDEVESYIPVQEIKPLPKDASVEEYVPDDIKIHETSEERPIPRMNNRPSRARQRMRPSNQMAEKNNEYEKRDKEFEQFMDEHAISRKILNKDIMKNFKDLSPEMKAIILSNVFNKFDD